MKMFVCQLCMPMQVFVVFRQVEPDSRCHDGCGRKGECRYRVTKGEDSDRHSDEGGNGEERAGTSRSKRAQRGHEEHQAQSVANRANCGSGSDRAKARPTTSCNKSDEQVDGTGGDSFECRYLARVFGGHKLSQVVIERPARAGAGDSNCSPGQLESTRLPCNGQTADEDEREPDSNSCAKAFAKDEPGQQRSENNFEIQ